MSEEQVSQFMARAEALLASTPVALSPVGAGLIAALEMNIASDSRGFSRLLGIEHALVLREIARLSGPDGFLAVTSRNARTLRTSLALTPRAAALA